jgi:GGDEF domain-containing protein
VWISFFNFSNIACNTVSNGLQCNENPMRAATTAPTLQARSAGLSEHQKAVYRILVFGILALFGPSAFGIEVGLLSVLYSLVLVLYALWGLRLTVLFRDDASLGYLLGAFDVALTAPLVIWGSGAPWVVVSLFAIWAAGLGLSLTARRHADDHSDSDTVIPSADPVTGLQPASRFVDVAEEEIQLADATGRPLALVALQVCRYSELVTCHGPAAADRAMSSVSKRGLRTLGEDAVGFRLRPDAFAWLVRDCRAAEAAEAAAALSRAVNSRLIEGRRVDSWVGCALYPRDGEHPGTLLLAALSSSGARPAGRGTTEHDAVAATGAPRVRSLPARRVAV